MGGVMANDKTFNEHRAALKDRYDAAMNKLMICLAVVLSKLTECVGVLAGVNVPAYSRTTILKLLLTQGDFRE